MTWIDGYQKWLSETESLNNAQMVANHFSGTEWSKEAISAMCGNMRHESSINPDMYEYGYSWEADRGYGLVQWTPRSKYWNWATSNNLPPRDGDSQLARIDYEVDNNIQWIPISRYNNMTFKQFRTNSGNWSVDYLTEAFTWSYERPNASAGEASMPERKRFANRCFNELDWSGTGGCPDFVYPTVKRVTSGFRPPDRPDHNGIDFAESGYHEIKASADGIVSRSYFSTSYGESIFIKHDINGQSYETVYAHMREGSRRVFEGDLVLQNEVIGVMGNTGDSTGQHLHFELNTPVWVQGGANAIDPLPYLGDCGNVKPPEPPDKKGDSELIILLLADTLNGWKF